MGIVSSENSELIEFCDGDPPDGGGAPYFASAVTFDGNSYLSCPALSAVDSGIASWSFWIKHAGAPVAPPVFNVDEVLNNNIVFKFYAAGRITLSFADPTFAKEYIWISPLSSFPTAEWVHILISVNLNLPAGNKICSVYVNDIAITPQSAPLDNDAAFDLTFNSLQNVFFGSESETSYTGDAADTWFGPNVSLLSGSSISEENRRLFISATGKPVNPYGFPASAVLFSGDALTFENNQGSGGAFSLVGSLTDASSSPSD